MLHQAIFQSWQFHCFSMKYDTSWWFQLNWKIIVKIGSNLDQVKLLIKNIGKFWNHLLEFIGDVSVLHELVSAFSTTTVLDNQLSHQIPQPSHHWGCTMSSWTDQVHLGSGQQNACGETMTNMHMWMVYFKK